MSKGNGSVESVESVIAAFHADYEAGGYFRFVDGDKAIEPALTCYLRALDARKAELNRKLAALAR